MNVEVQSEWHGDEVAAQVNGNITDALRNAGELLLDTANVHCPIDTGALYASGAVSADGDECYVSYDTPYAVRVHEHPEYNFQGDGRGKWLESALNENQERLTEIIHNAMQQAISGGGAL